MTAAAIVAHLDHFQHRVVQDAMHDATGRYWRRRAATFEWARPRLGDFMGFGNTAERVAARDEALVAARDACLRRAEMAVAMFREAA